MLGWEYKLIYVYINVDMIKYRYMDYYINSRWVIMIPFKEEIYKIKDQIINKYKPDEWNKYKNDTTTFANLISRTRVKIYD